MTIKVVVGKNLLAENEKRSEHLREEFRKRGIRVVNILSSPGAGKTSMLEEAIPRLTLRPGVIEGDVATTRDAERLSRFRIPLVQITTLGACHLDSAMVWKALSEMDLERVDLLFIENVGNLVCPASFDLGEDLRVIVFSVAEGADKPAKYPRAFLTSQVVLINKMDLLPYTDVDLRALEEEIRGLNPTMEIFRMSCRTKEGFDAWIQWLETWARRA